MSDPILYPLISKTMAILYWPTFFFCLWAISKANEVKDV